MQIDDDEATKREELRALTERTGGRVIKIPAAHMERAHSFSDVLRLRSTQQAMPAPPRFLFETVFDALPKFDDKWVSFDNVVCSGRDDTHNTCLAYVVYRFTSTASITVYVPPPPPPPPTSTSSAHTPDFVSWGAATGDTGERWRHVGMLGGVIPSDVPNHAFGLSGAMNWHACTLRAPRVAPPLFETLFTSGDAVMVRRDAIHRIRVERGTSAATFRDCVSVRGIAYNTPGNAREARRIMANFARTRPMPNYRALYTDRAFLYYMGFDVGGYASLGAPDAADAAAPEPQAYRGACAMCAALSATPLAPTATEHARG
jgi:hypothetical protein